MSNLFGAATHPLGLDSAIIGYSPRDQNIGGQYYNLACITAFAFNKSNYNLFTGVTSSNNITEIYNGMPTSGVLKFVVDNAGNVKNATGNYGTISDYRVKKNVEDMEENLSVINLRPVSYNLIDKYNINNKIYGFIAHEVQEFLPHLVTGEKDEVGDDGEIKEQTVNLVGLIPILVNNIIKKYKKIIYLENEIQNIKNLL
jgi:hypothetical protein